MLSMGERTLDDGLDRLLEVHNRVIVIFILRDKEDEPGGNVNSHDHTGCLKQDSPLRSASIGVLEFTGGIVCLVPFERFVRGLLRVTKI